MYVCRVCVLCVSVLQSNRMQHMHATIDCCDVSCCAVALYHDVACCAVLRWLQPLATMVALVLCHAVSRCLTLCHAVSCCVMLCHTVSLCVMLCVVLCREVLCSLSGSSHHVHTGVALVLPRVSAAAAAAGGGSSNSQPGEPFCRTFSETTNVMFADLSSELVDAYIHTGESGWGVTGACVGGGGA
jgi:hypothetical protein